MNNTEAQLKLLNAKQQMKGELTYKRVGQDYRLISRAFSIPTDAIEINGKLYAPVSRKKSVKIS